MNTQKVQSWIAETFGADTQWTKQLSQTNRHDFVWHQDRGVTVHTFAVHLKTGTIVGSGGTIHRAFNDLKVSHSLMLLEQEARKRKKAGTFPLPGPEREGGKP